MSHSGGGFDPGTARVNAMATVIYPPPLVSWACPILPTQPQPRTPPGFAPYAPFLDRFPGTGALFPLGLPRSRVAPP